MNNIGSAFSFPFKDPDWLSKFLLGTLFSFLSLLLIGIPVTCGYYVELLQRVRRGEQYPLPEWKDVGVKFVVGIKYLALTIIYHLPILLVLIPVILMMMATMFALGGSDITGFFMAPYFIVIFVLVVPYALFINLLMPIISIEFSEQESIGQGLRVGNVFAIFKRHWQDALIATLITIGISSLVGLGLLAFIIGLFTATFYVHLVSFHLYGQIAQAMDNSTSVPTERKQ